MINFTGHGSMMMLGSNLLAESDLPDLIDLNHLPVLTITSCLTANFGVPTLDSLGEELLLMNNGGSIAILGPSGLVESHRGRELTQYFYQAVFEGQYERLGDAVVSAKKHYGSTGFDLHILDLVNLLGDPATLIH